MKAEKINRDIFFILVNLSFSNSVIPEYLCNEREFSQFKYFWTPASAGVTVLKVFTGSSIHGFRNSSIPNPPIHLHRYNSFIQFS